MVGLRGVLVASLAFAALAFPACASVDPEPLPEERAAADAIRGAFREVPPTPSGVRRDPDWGAYVDPGATATVPPSVCPEGISDLDVRVVKRTSIPEVGARLPQESEGKGEGRQSSWSAGGESVGAYVSVNRDFFAYGSRRIAAYVWCDGGSR